MRRTKQICPNGLKTKTQYLEELEQMYPNVPFETIKKLEKKIFNETELKQELEKLDRTKSS